MEGKSSPDPPHFTRCPYTIGVGLWNSRSREKTRVCECPSRLEGFPRAGQPIPSTMITLTKETKKEEEKKMVVTGVSLLRGT